MAWGITQNLSIQDVIAFLKKYKKSLHGKNYLIFKARKKKLFQLRKSLGPHWQS